ncbi:hypothetical protein N7493_008002 [Penicillium malachiteum]|uniref:Uncharacterized protein n=1 Tax=Penicillium malachiteum TaxID=1324776 RepID=A0AAD6HGF6_9EURO|nr:hypothetical protein N7493_008002 [Penicillium malachiteum]
MGTGGMGIFGAGLAAKIIFTKGLFATVQAEEARVEDRLLNANNSPALLYDVGKKTGFIVPELNVCLQILHVWASRQADKQEILSKIPFIPETTAGSEIALKAVISNKELLLREGYADEKPLYFMSKLKEIFLSLEQRKEQRRIFDEPSIRIGAHCLRGWELVDIAACRPSWEKGVRLPFGMRLGGHPADSCYKIIRDNPDMIVLFSEGTTMQSLGSASSRPVSYSGKSEMPEDIIKKKRGHQEPAEVDTKAVHVQTNRYRYI